MDNSTLRNFSSGNSSSSSDLLNSSNSCDIPSQKPERYLSVFISVIFIRVIVIVTCIGGNFLLIRAFYKFSTLRTASNLILVSLCIADCFIAMTFIFDIIHLALKKGDKIQCILCQINASLTLSITMVIVLHLALISVERVIAVKFPLRYNSILTNRRALLASVVKKMTYFSFPRDLKARARLHGCRPRFMFPVEAPFFSKFRAWGMTTETNTVDTHNTTEANSARRLVRIEL